MGILARQDGSYSRQYVVRFYYGIQDGMKFTMYGLLISQILLLIFLGYVGMQVMSTVENKSTDNKGWLYSQSDTT